MKRLTTLALTVSSVFLLIGCGAHSHETSHNHDSNHNQSTIVIDGLEISQQRAKATVPGIKVASGYLTISNQTEEPVRLVGAESSEAMHVEFHAMFMRDSTMAMRKIDDLVIEAGQSFELKPGGHHLMFMDIKQRFVEGDTVTVTLIDENGSRYAIELPIVETDDHKH